MKVVLTSEAEADLEDIGDAIAAESPDRALKFVEGLRQKCGTLAHMPYRFPSMPRYERSGIRRRVHGNYLIFYKIQADTVQIVRIVHGARDLERLLFPP